MKIEARKNFLINTFFFSTVLALIYFTVKFMLGFLLPFVIGVCIAFISRKIAKRLYDKKSKATDRVVALITVALYILVITSVFLILWILISFLSNTISNNFSNIADVFLNLKQLIEKLLSSASPRTKNIVLNMLENFYQNLILKTGEGVSSIATKLIKNMPRFFISSIVTVTASFYIAKDYNRLLKFLKSIIKPSVYQNIMIIKDIFIESVLKLFSGYLILSLITFIILLIGFGLFGFNNFANLALLIGFVDILPILGAGIIMVPWSIVSFLNSDFKTGFSVITLYVAVVVVRNVLEPKIISKKMGTNPLLTLLAIFLGYKISGFLGMIMLPVALIITLNFYKRQSNYES